MSIRVGGPRVPHGFTGVSMDTGITIQVISDQPREQVEPVVQRALDWFDAVERICTRFDRTSEVMHLLDSVGRPVGVSTLLYEVASFAIDLAQQTRGAFDPTIGATMEQLGFDTNYRTGEAIRSGLSQADISFRDVRLDRAAHTILLRRPLVLDLNAVAKGLAIDLAARELSAFSDVCVEAGGDLYVRGHNAAGAAWRVGIQHPRAEGLLARTLHLTNTAVCTSGDYQRRSAVGSVTHVLNGRTRRPVTDVVSVTVLAPTAMAADGISTAAMALGREAGLRFLRDQGVRALVMAADGSESSVNL